MANPNESATWYYQTNVDGSVSSVVTQYGLASDGLFHKSSQTTTVEYTAASFQLFVQLCANYSNNGVVFTQTDATMVIALREAIEQKLTTIEKVLAVFGGVPVPDFNAANFYTSAPETLTAAEALSYTVTTNVLTVKDVLLKVTPMIHDAATTLATSAWAIPAGETFAHAAIDDWSATGNAAIAAVVANDAKAQGITLPNTTATATAAADFHLNDSSYADLIQKAYIAFFDRPCDPTAFNNWVSELNSNGGDVSDLMEVFAPSDEYLSMYAGKTNAQLVDAVFHNLFGRAADEEGLTFWGGALDRGDNTIGDIAYEVLGGAQTADKLIIANKVAAANIFTKALDTAANVNEYSGNDSAAEARTWLKTVTTVASSVQTAENQLPNMLKMIGASGTVSGSTITLNHVDRDANIIAFMPGQTLKTADLRNFDGTVDKVDLSGFDFTDTGVTVKTGLTASPAFVTANFFAGNDVAIASTGTSSHVYVDTNQDGTYTPGTDLDIKLTGV